MIKRILLLDLRPCATLAESMEDRRMEMIDGDTLGLDFNSASYGFWGSFGKVNCTWLYSPLL